MKNTRHATYIAKFKKKLSLKGSAQFDFIKINKKSMLYFKILSSN